MFQLPKLVGFRYTTLDGIVRMLSVAEAEAKFRHEELYGRHAAPFLMPIWERKSVKSRRSSAAVIPSRVLTWLAVSVATIAGWMYLDCNGGFAETILRHALG